MHTFTKSWLRISLLISLMILMVLQAGCYRRVVSTRGMGTKAMTTEESYQEDWPIETIGRELQKSDNPRYRDQRSQQKSTTDRGGQRILSPGN